MLCRHSASFWTAPLCVAHFVVAVHISFGPSVERCLQTHDTTPWVSPSVSTPVPNQLARVLEGWVAGLILSALTLEYDGPT